MTIGGEQLVETNVGTYAAVFTLKDGYKWSDEGPSVRTASVD